jgi:hypothetical protein
MLAQPGRITLAMTNSPSGEFVSFAPLSPAPPPLAPRSSSGLASSPLHRQPRALASGHLRPAPRRPAAPPGGSAAKGPSATVQRPIAPRRRNRPRSPA